MKFPVKALLLSLVTIITVSKAAPVDKDPSSSSLVRQSLGSGYNDFNCKPSEKHPRPVILIHGTALSSASWHMFGPKIAKAGFCVFSLTFGKWKDIPIFGGLAPIHDSAAEVGAFAGKVLAATGTNQADFVGHSQGGILARYWYNYLGGTGKINRMIGIAPITHGTTLHGLTTLAIALGLLDLGHVGLDPFAPALMQLVVNSTFMQQLNAHGDTLPNVFQANIVTKYDELVTPYLSGFQTGAGVVNEVLQDLCVLDLHEHIFMPESKVVIQWTLHQLDPSSQPNANCLSMI
ncbi:hypothetical protein BGZ83_006296 [Gryganskiella cystojenkinii]|nr:hypothetical protein BGZ83_006296 [Gryganskiella cystojenkinii]